MAENRQIVAPEVKSDKPFVLIWAEKTAVDVLRKADVTFSEAVDGLSGQSLGESAETTGSNPEGADTTIGG